MRSRTRERELGTIAEPRASAAHRPAPQAGETIRSLQTTAGNRATVRLVGRRTLQRQPTIDLDTLYAGKGSPTIVADFARLQALLSDREASLAHLRLLSDALRSRLDGGAAPRAELLDAVLASFERQCGFSAERPVLVGFASSDDFKALTRAGHQFHDVGAGQMHGEFTHRIQWFIAMSAVTGMSFDGRAHPPYNHSPVELYAASIDEAYAVDATSVTGTAYMWDWVFDRIKGMYPKALGPSSDYDPKRDAWTHPGETGQLGALSNDILSGELEGIGALTLVRQRQFEDYAAGKASMTRWFDVASELRLAEGKAVTGGPSYFQRALIPGPDAIRHLRHARFFANALIERVESWALLAPIAFDPQVANVNLPVLRQVNVEATRLWTSLKEDQRSLPGSTSLATALLDAWFGALMIAVQQAYGAIDGITAGTRTDGARLAPLLADLDRDLRAIRARPSWAIVE